MHNRLAIGGNVPPTEAEILAQRLAEYRDEAATLKQLAARIVPDAVNDDAQAGEMSDYIQAAKNLKTKIGEIHKKEKQPFWDAGKQADAWKNDYEAKINALIVKAEAPMLAWNRAKEKAERDRQLEIARLARIEADKLALEAAAHETEGIHDTAQELMQAAVQGDIKADMITQNALDVKVASRGGFSSSGIKREWTGRIESLAALDLEALRKYFKEDDITAAINRAVKDGVRELRGAIIYEAESLSTRGRR